LVFRHADAFAHEILRFLDPVGADIDRGMAEAARHERRYPDIGARAERGLQREARQRQLANVEILRAEGAEEYLLRAQLHEHGIDAVDGYGSVDQGPVTVVVADGDRKVQLGHAASSGKKAASHRPKGPRDAKLAAGFAPPL
jgi:hypothetical protein